MKLIITRRQKALKDLLMRNADKLDEWMTRGLVGSLKIPVAWIDEAKVWIAMLIEHLPADILHHRHCIRFLWACFTMHSKDSSKPE